MMSTKKNLAHPLAAEEEVTLRSVPRGGSARRPGSSALIIANKLMEQDSLRSLSPTTDSHTQCLPGLPHPK